MTDVLARKTIETKEQLRALMGEPSERAVKKQMDRLDAHCRAIIARSPFLVLGTSGADGRCDVSPKGDLPGFTLVLDDRTMVIPERPGNKRVDSLTNILENPHVGLLFVVPGREETLRVNGRASIVLDEDLLARMAHDGKPPILGIRVEVQEAYAHCAKAFKRSGLWEPARWPDVADLPTLAQMMVDQCKLTDPVDEVHASIEDAYKTRLW